MKAQERKDHFFLHLSLSRGMSRLLAALEAESPPSLARRMEQWVLQCAPDHTHPMALVPVHLPDSHPLAPPIRAYM